MTRSKTSFGGRAGKSRCAFFELQKTILRFRLGALTPEEAKRLYGDLWELRLLSGGAIYARKTEGHAVTVLEFRPEGPKRTPIFDLTRERPKTLKECVMERLEAETPRRFIDAERFFREEFENDPEGLAEFNGRLEERFRRIELARNIG